MRTRFERPSLGQVFLCISFLGIIFAAFVLGAAWMHFRLPSSDLLDKAFVGGKAFRERGAPPAAYGGGVRTDKPGVTRDRPEKTFDGFTLTSTSLEAEARLVDMQGKTIHRWALPFSKAMPNPSHVKPLSDEHVHVYCSHLYPNGDLLVVYQSGSDTPPGYGLAKLDRDSKLLWRYENSVHHSVDVGEDGKIYTLVSRLSSEAPRGLEWIHVPFVVDFLVVLSPEGKELERVNLLEAYRDSPFAPSLSMTESVPDLDPALFVKGLLAKGEIPPEMPKDLGKGPAGPRGRQAKRGPPEAPAGTAQGDILHLNSIRVLNPSMAPKFPMYQANQVLVSMRSINTIAVVDLKTHAVTASVQGPWKAQHQPEFLENGRVLIYDNGGSSKGSRILEYDPRTGATPWCYANENATPFFAPFCGMAQRLPNGNTLIVDPTGMRVFEITQAKEIVWEMGCQPPDDDKGEAKSGSLTSARRVLPSQISFLKGDIRARP